MIKIIKKGKKDIQQFKCPACGCEFETDEYKNMEVVEVVNKSNFESFIPCPECEYNCENKF